ncbi:MAG TPA: TetR/AcrR family transcriptional regulator [Spirochaetia bacterium]|nr:TetR/AcrR family transcriptional regulator [Spirochaetia bacterium]
MARPRDREKPAQIINAAFSVFGEIGYEATRISHIAERAGISSGTIYTYFKDKKDLFRATAQDRWDRFLTQIRGLADSQESTRARMQSLIEIGFTSLKNARPLLRGMLFESSQMNLLQGNLDELYSLIENILAERTPQGEETAADIQQRRALIRITVVGVLFSVALAKPTHVDREIRSLQHAIALRLAEAGS